MDALEDKYLVLPLHHKVRPKDIKKIVDSGLTIKNKNQKEITITTNKDSIKKTLVEYN